MNGALGPNIVIVTIVVSQILLPAASAAPDEPFGRLPTGETAVVGPFSFEIGPYELTRLPIEVQRDYGTTIVTCPMTDTFGVAMYRAADGTIHNHPVAQARCAAYMLRNYWLTDDPLYLERAIANGERLLATAEMHGDAMFFPYSFNYSTGRSFFSAPWYSAMAQGLALSAFVRLFEWTEDAAWRQAADRVFRSFKVARMGDRPWVVDVEHNRLWLDEYPTVPLDRTFNGHNFSLFGLYDYWRITDDPEARLLTLGAMHSAYLGGVGPARVPGGISQYCFSEVCLEREIRNPAYHPTHVNQFVSMFRITGHWHFASLAEAYLGDNPRPSAGSVQLSAGPHDGYRFDSAGNGTLALSVTIPETVAAPYSRREVPGGRHQPGNGIWMYVTHGALAGHWVRESSRAMPLGFTDDLYFYRHRSVRTEAGTYVGSTYDASGASTGLVSATTSAATWTYTHYSRINGRPSVLLTSGPLDGSWLALDARTLRDSTSMSDIDASIFRSDIIWLTTKGITRGCGTHAFCPMAVVTREQMASFLVRALRLPATNRDFFGDDGGQPHESDTNRLAAAGITAGCGPGRFCPRAPVTREQMASFLVRAIDLPATSTDFFGDDRGSPHEDDINRLAAAGVTGGCDTDRFCPRDDVSRGQMAAFLHRGMSRAATFGVTGGEPVDPGADVPSPSIEPSPTPSAASSPSESDPAPTSEPAPEPTIGPATPEPEPTTEPPTSGTPTPTSEPTRMPMTTPTPGASGEP